MKKTNFIVFCSQKIKQIQTLMGGTLSGKFVENGGPQFILGQRSRVHPLYIA
jgi:hypothetical protein